MAVTSNIDIAALHARILRFVTELHHAVSRKSALANPFDMVRTKAALDAIDSLHAFVIGEPAIDVVDTELLWTLGEMLPWEEFESEVINDLIRMYTILEHELVKSNSVSMISGLTPYDSARLTAMVERIRRFIIDYVEVVTPLDLPGSTPKLNT